MIEGTPQLHANAWKVSSACHVPVNVPVVDPCNINQQNVGYASQCDLINQDLFAPCHTYISPELYYQLCRFDACKCGSTCLCNALAHYAYVCHKHGITVDFRSHVSSCALVCKSGMQHHQCSSLCERSCTSLSSLDVCDHDCAEGCNCPEGKYFEASINFCVPISSCRCYYKGRSFQPGEMLPTPSGLCQCLNGTMKCTEAAAVPAVHTCPEEKIYYDCRSHVPGVPPAGVNCELSCANLAMNFTCTPSPPCVSGCVCPPGMAEHKGKCYVPDSCPCTWKNWEYMSGEIIATPCYTCACRRGIFNCTYYPCPAVCTVYGDRHYYTFDGLEYDFVSDCQVYLVKSSESSNMSIIIQNKKCFDNDIICSKSVFISVGDIEIYFSDPVDVQRMLRIHENKTKYQLWKAGHYTAVHFPEQEITVLWDRKTTMHIKVGAQWKGKLAGLCGNFDKFTSNDLTTSNNMEVRNAQLFGESWAIGQCASPNDTIKPCEVHQSKFPYAKKECSILYSDVFAPCRNVIDVTSFVKNCHTDTCNCNLGGDCECLCTSIAAYAHKCCQQGAVIHWRSPSLCSYDCDYYNQGLGEGPYILASYGQNDTVIGVNISSRKIFPLPRTSANGNVYFNFMLTPGLFKDKILSPSLASLESAERPNYFLYVHDNDSVCLEQWETSASFRRRATFFHHQGLWIPGYSAFELHSKKGFFITLTTTGVKVSKYDDSEEFKRSSSFSIEELHAAIPYRRMCEWRYEPCSSPCVKTCSDPEGIACKFLPPVEGCLPYCPKDMILDEVTLKCVNPEDCIPIKPTESVPVTQQTTEIFSQMSTMFVTEEIEPAHINLTTKMTMEGVTTLKGTNATGKLLTDSAVSSMYLPDFLPVPEQPSEVGYSTTSPPVLLRPISPTISKVLAVTLKDTSYSTTPSLSISLHPSTLVVSSFPAFPLTTTESTIPLEYTTPLAMLGTLPLGSDFIKIPTSILTTGSLATSQSQTSGAATQSLTSERISYSSPVLFTGSPSTQTFSVTSRSRSTETHPLIYPFSLSKPITSESPVFTSRFTTFATSPFHITSASDMVTVQSASQISTGTFMPMSASLKTLLTPSEHIVPLITKHLPVTDRIRTSSSVVKQTPTSIWYSLSPKETYMMPTLIPPPITTQRPKATGEVTIVSKSFHVGPSTASLSGTPQTSETLSKHTLLTDSSPVLGIHGSSTEFARTRVLPSSTSTLPVMVSYDTPQTTSKATVHLFDLHTELKTAAAIKSSDTFPTSTEFSGTLSALTSPSILLTLLSTTRSSAPQTSASETHLKRSSAIPTVSMKSAVKPAGTRLQMPVVSLGMHPTSRSPGSYPASFPPVIPLLTSSEGISETDTSSLPPPEISDLTIQPLGTRSSSLASPDSRTLSSLPSGLETQSVAAALTLWNISAIPDITEKYSPSSPVHLLVSSASTIVPSQTAQITDLSSIGFEFYTTTASVPVPATSQIPTYTPSFTLFTSKPSTEAFRTTAIKTDEITVPDGAKQNATSTRKTAYALESSQTSEVKEYVTEAKHVSPQEPSLLALSMSPIQAISSISESSTASVKPVSVSEVMDRTLSDWSRVPPPKSVRPYHNVTEPEQMKIDSLKNFTVTDSPYFTTEPVRIQTSQTETEIITESVEHASFGTMIHTLISVTSPECTPRYLDPVDRCSQYVCINMGWMLYNLSRNCHKNVEKPDCGFRGMPVQVNSDSCCPEWECPCQCSVLSELSIITFDGNNVALYKVASYILVKLPTEIIVAHIEKCPTNQSANSIRKTVPPGSASGLCFKKLNVTTSSNTILINRLARKVVVDSVIQPLPFSKHGLCIQDTGAMYVINTPAGINIKWAHVTGIIDVQYGFHSNTTTRTEGLCGVCNGDPVDDLRMQNRTIITNMEEIESFIKSWEIEKSVDVTTRRPIRNCTEDNCTYCMELLNRWAFSPCHKKVSPQDFCEKMWINNTYFWNYECDALSAYVALCNKHNICIKWRTPDYCSLSCPSGKEYQPCVQPCAAKTCLNKWFYEESPCSYLREDCVCKNGTILHRTDADLCIPEEKCTCTDNEGQPRASGEVWNGSTKGCCMYKCLENGSIVAIEPECSEEPPPICEREGETIIHVIEERACCPKKVCECNMSLCDSIIPTCKSTEKLVVGYSLSSCCPQYRCDCDPSACPNASRPECREDQFIVEAKQEDPCCFSYLCVCESCIEPIPLCNEGEILTVDLSTTQYCCPHYHCVCDENLCPLPFMNCSADMKLLKKRVPGQCCSAWQCECDCENATVPACKVGEVQRIHYNILSTCGCTQYTCEKDNVCVFQEVTVLNPGQSMIQYLDGDLCYTVKCSLDKDPRTGFHAMDLTVINCSQKCEAHQIYIPSLSQHSCCGTCINVSCTFYSENGTLVIYEEGATWDSNCTKYECAKTAIGAVILGSSVVCPSFNETECTKNGGIIQTYNDGCCKTCSGRGVLPFAISPVVSTDNINCEPGKRDERICQKVTVRTTIRKHDCVSRSPINVASCDGKCPSATIFNVNIDSHLRFCKCCRENGIQNLTVPLYCSGNGTEIMYVIPEPTDCSCQWN
ncbi:otogelin-like protein isoform X3 [Paroedura picta]